MPLLLSGSGANANEKSGEVGREVPGLEEQVRAAKAGKLVDPKRANPSLESIPLHDLQPENQGFSP